MNHVEFFFGFVGLAIVWQIGFLVISTDPRRYRPLMLVGVLEKISFGVPVIILWPTLARDRRAGGAIDLLLGVLFLIAWLRVGQADIAVTR